VPSHRTSHSSYLSSPSETTKSSRWLNIRITTKDSDDQDWFAPDKVDKRTPQLPPIDLDAKSLTMSLQCPTTYAIDKFRKFEYVPLGYFTELGCRAAVKDKASNEGLWDVTKTRDNCPTLQQTHNHNSTRL
jgi:hypothetical protein